MIINDIRVRRDTAANWTSRNPVLRNGEPGLEKDTQKLKFGDGVTAWSGLSYSGRITDGGYGEITVSGSTWTIETGVVSKLKLSLGVQESLDKADSALQSIGVGTVTIPMISATGAPSDTKVLYGDGVWRTAGDTTGPASSENNSLVRFDGATGKILKDSAATLSNGGTLTLSGLVATSVGAVTGTAGEIGITLQATGGGVIIFSDGAQTMSVQSAALTSDQSLVLPDESGTIATREYVNGHTPLALGTPASGVLTNCTGLPAAGVLGLGDAAVKSSSTGEAADGSEAGKLALYGTGGKISASLGFDIVTATGFAGIRADGVGVDSTWTLANDEPAADVTVASREWAADHFGAVITDIVQDTTPQLGGNLDLNGKSIVAGAATVSPTEMGYLDGVSSAIQPQLNDRVTASSMTTTLSSYVTLTGAQTLTDKTLISPVLTTPALGTPASGLLTNCTGLPLAGLEQGGAAPGQVLAWSGSAYVPTTLATPATPVLSGTVSMDLPRPSAKYHSQTFSAPGVLGSMHVIAGLAPTDDTDENDATGLDPASLSAASAADAVTISVSFHTAQSGPVKVHWLAF